MRKSSVRKKSIGPQSPSGVIFSLIAIALLSIGIVQVAAQVPMYRDLSAHGSLRVLGDSDEQKMSEEQKKLQETQVEAAKKQLETPKAESRKMETEQKMPNGTVVKTKIEDSGKSKIEIENKSLKLKMESHDRVATQGAREMEREIESESETPHVSTESGRPSITHRDVRAQSDFPLSINASTSALMVTTPRGQKTVTILPDQAVNALRNTGLISTSSGQLSSTPSVRLTERNGATVYEVRGTKQFRLFGLIPVETPTDLVVSAEDGAILSQQRSVLSSIIDFLSP